MDNTKNNAQWLRDDITDSIEQIKNGTMPLDRARAVQGMYAAQIGLAQVEVAHMKVTNSEVAATFFVESEPIPSLEIQPKVITHKLGK